MTQERDATEAAATEADPTDTAWLRPETAVAEELPRPGRERWQPLRLGLVDLFYYDDEQFWFHDGRLLLRGNNGTGKSKVLALTLPFVLDGSLQPRRVEPDADPKKRMDWNLLLGGAHGASERTGYAWVELGRVDADGTEHFTTLGIGLKAASGRGIVKTWYFTSTRRIGDLRLIDAQRTVLTQERLRDELAQTRSGQVYGTQQAYRRAVDEALFRLGEARYDALIDLLIQLRQPQLSKKPDERALSAALTEALTPLDQAIVADVAESFRSLEEERSDVATTRETLAAADGFLRHYGSYARVATRRRTTAVREANSAYEWAGRDLGKAETDLAEAAEDVRLLHDAQRELDDRRSRLEGERQGLRDSSAAKDATRLEAADAATRKAEEWARRVAKDAEHSRGALLLATQGVTAATQRVEEAADAVASRSEVSAHVAQDVGLAAAHTDAVDDERAAARSIARRRDQVRHVRGLLDRAESTAATLARRQAVLDDAEAASARREEEVRRTQVDAEAAVASYLAAVDGYLAGLSVLEVSEDVEASAASWARTLLDEAPVRSAIHRAAVAARELHGRRRADAAHEVARLEAELAALRLEIAELAAGREPEPPPVPWLDRAARVDRPGAQLWRLTDFAPGVPDHERASIEAALMSAGLLDAWVFPSGELSVDGDVVLGPAGAPAARALDGVLVPAVDVAGSVDEAVVAQVLCRIGLGEESGAAIWVDRDGGWGSGPARGAWRKERAEFIGAGAREANRREVLASLRATEADLAARLAEAHQLVVAAEELLERVGAEEAGYPARSERELFSADARATSARHEADEARDRASEARDHRDTAATADAEARRELAEQAAELRLGATRDQLDALAAALAAYETSLTQLRDARRALSLAELARDEARARASGAAERSKDYDREAAEAQDDASFRRAELETLRSTVGTSVLELQERLASVEAQLDGVAADLRRNDVERGEASGRVGALQEKVRALGIEREAKAQARDAQVRGLHTFAATGLLRVALVGHDLPDPDDADAWGLTATLGLARRAEPLLADTDESDDAWRAAQQRVSTAATDLATQMSRHGHTSFLEPHDDVMVARVGYRGEEVDIDRLAVRLREDVEERELLLSAREREILENHLVNEIAGHLHELLLAADTQIDRMNRELAARRTSTGMVLRVTWRELRDGPSGLAAARELMMRSDATWTPEDRAAIGQFLQARIAEVRLADPTGGWLEHLELALDYRQWHEFTVERQQNGQWRPASGPASGGEKVLAVSIPLFAAASAHYNSAGAHAPRLILLDEAFAGVDDGERAKSLGLLATFDLDVVMTSEREWGCYPQVPGLAIAQLSRVEEIDAVGVTRWRWDGHRRERLGEVAPAARASGSPDSSGPLADDATLFG